MCREANLTNGNAGPLSGQSRAFPVIFNASFRSDVTVNSDMFRKSSLARCLAPGIVWLLASCATPGGIGAPAELMLGEVSFILTRDQIVADQLGTTKITDFYKSVLAEGLTDKEIDAGQVIVIQGAIYWVNTVSGIKHNRLAVALLPQGMVVDPGNIVEVRDPGRPHFYTVERVRARNRVEGQCGYFESLSPLPWQITKDILGLVSLLGPSGQATLYCQGIENEGWTNEGLYWSRKSSSLTPDK